jgi:DNA helicase-2/ATP-dependent DNA helicase PcrA
METISSDSVLSAFNSNFRVTAGPGAGKTHWLINHIKEVVSKSNKLSTSRYIACISYTNVAAEEIKERLGDYGERVEVSTIHSFLYKSIVKPYLHLLKDDNGASWVDYARVDGHDEHRPHIGIVRDWLTSAGAWGTLSSKLVECCDYLKKLKWLRNTGGDWYLGTIGFTNKPQYFPSRSLDSYKPLYWKRGIIDHEDVLYFALILMEKYPQLQAFLSARYPYLFIDEFQDTNPVQTQIVTWLADQGTYVGIIGDLEQSIFSFQGAKPQDFGEFTAPSLCDYIINGNRRSTDKIIELLNHVRTDPITQRGIREIEGEQIGIYVGNLQNVIPAIQNSLLPDERLYILARSNEEVANIRRAEYTGQENVWSEFETIDQSRSRLMEDVVTSVELARRGMLTQALTRLKRALRVFRSNGEVRNPFRFSGDKVDFNDKVKRAISVSILTTSLAQYDSLRDKLLLEAYVLLDTVLGNAVNGLGVVRMTRGRAKDFAEGRKYGDFIDSVRLPASETRHIRTIHQAKSTEFSNVLIACNHLDSNKAEQQLKRILNPQEYPQCEERRILYVGLSRAKNRLFISIPEISVELEQKAQNIGITIIRVPENPAE